MNKPQWNHVDCRLAYLLCVLFVSIFTLPTDAQEKFKFTCGISKYETAFAGAKANITFNTKIDGGKSVFHAGEFWDQVWVRDGSYSIQLGAGLLDTITSKGTFQYCTDTWNGKTVAMQDVCGHFGGWPALTDAIVWATGAWELYCIKGDRAFLAWAYPIVKNSLEHAETDVLDKKDGLFKGCSSFMESNSAYPASFANNGSAVAATKAMSTNALHYNAYLIAAKMGRSLGVAATESNNYDQKAKALKDSINKYLWLPDSGFYGYFKYADGKIERRMEGLGEAFAVLFGVADAARSESVFKNTPISPYGIGCLAPQYPDHDIGFCGGATCYHNGHIWPFVQGYWAWAASKYKKTDVFMNEMSKLEASYSRMTPDEYREMYNLIGGTEAGGGHQLWSAAGYLSMVYHGLFGMDFEESGIRFDPLVPPVFADSLMLTNVMYRSMTLNIVIKGSGVSVRQFLFDGVEKGDPFIAGNLTGVHTVRIVMSPNPVGTSGRPNSSHIPTSVFSISTSSGMPGATALQITTTRAGVVTLFNARGSLLKKVTVRAPGKMTLTTPRVANNAVFAVFDGVDGTRMTSGIGIDAVE